MAAWSCCIPSSGQEIRGGSPATDTIRSGLESGKLIDDIDVDGAPNTATTVDVNDDKSESLEDEKGPQDDATPTSSTIKHRRELLDSKLKGYKHCLSFLVRRHLRARLSQIHHNALFWEIRPSQAQQYPCSCL